MPANFFLGFDEYATSLPDSAAAPLLGQELQAHRNCSSKASIDARVDALTRFPHAVAGRKSGRVADAHAEVAASAPLRNSEHVARRRSRRTSVDIAFSASPDGARRKVLNQIATAKQQLFIIRAP